MAATSKGPQREEGRCSHLVQPIRDLTENWNIDVAKELEEYLQEIEDLAYTFDGGNTTLNFVEAALLIQGSTCVYSRKVEYLHALVFQSLDQLAKQHKERVRRINIGEGEDTAAQSDANLDNIKEATNIDMGEGETGTDGLPRRNILIMRTPTSLLRRDQNQIYLADTKGSKIAKKQDFKMNTFSFHQTGAMVDPGEALRIDSSFTAIRAVGSTSLLHMFSRDHAANPYLEPMTVSTESIDGISVNPQLTDGSELQSNHEGPGGQGESDDEDGNQQDDNHGDQEPPMDGEHLLADGPLPIWGNTALQDIAMGEATSLPNEQSVGTIATATSTNWDPWTPADPHECTRTARPFKKGKTYRIPAHLTTEGKKNGNTLKTPVETLTDFYSRLEKDIECKDLPKNMLKAPSFPEFAEAFVKEYSRRKDVAQKERAALLELRRAQGELDLDTVFDESNFDAVSSRPPASDTEYDAHDSSDDNNDLDDQHFDLAAIDLTNSQTDGMTFEQMVRQHIDQYMSSARQYVQQDGLTNRVRDWEDRIIPILDEEEQHGPYDIKQYGESILKTGFDVDQPVATTFDELAKDKPPYEICRMFLAVLQLANTGNVDLVQDEFMDTVGETEAKRQVLVKLLDRNDLHTLDNFHEPVSTQ